MELSQNDWALLHATVVTWGWNRYQNKSEKVNPGEEHSPAAPAGTQTHDLLIKGLVL